MRFKGRRTISRYDRAAREMYYLFVVSRELAPACWLRKREIERETSSVHYKGTEGGPCLQALRLVCTRDVLAKRIRERVAVFLAEPVKRSSPEAVIRVRETNVLIALRRYIVCM